MTDDERTLAGALMRVNHVGEVCAQALYSAQSLATHDEGLRRQFERAAREETDHLAWTQQRLAELGARPSLLNPLWYGGAFAIGLLAGRAGDAVSLGFLVETERQVERHLEGHLQRLPAHDMASRVIVDQAHCIATGGSFDNGLPFSLSMGCGTWGGNHFSDNMNYKHYLNITRISRPIAERVPTETEIFGDYFQRFGKA